MKSLSFYFVLVFAILLTSCGKNTMPAIVSGAQNLPIPPSLEARTLYHDNSIIQYDLGSLTGYILEKTTPTSNWERIRPFVPKGFVTAPELIESGEFYNSIVDNRIAVKGGVQIPVMSVAASLESSQKMELKIEDQALLIVKDNLIPWEEIQKYLVANPKKEGAIRAWVQGAMLTRMYYKIANETKADATVSGSVFAVDGKVYNATGLAQRQSYITMLLIDLNQVEAKTKAAATGEIASSSATQLFQYKAYDIPKGGIK